MQQKQVDQIQDKLINVEKNNFALIKLLYFHFKLSIYTIFCKYSLLYL